MGLPGFANDQNPFPDETEEAFYFETSCEEKYGTQQRKETLKSQDEYIREQGKVRGPNGEIVGRFPICPRTSFFTKISPPVRQKPITG